MPKVNKIKNQETLDSLREVRRKLYRIPEDELDAMSLVDQTKYGDSLHKVGLAILRLETAEVKVVNEIFKEKEESLNSAAVQLERDLASLEDAVSLIQITSEGLTVVTNVIKLLA